MTVLWIFPPLEHHLPIIKLSKSQNLVNTFLCDRYDQTPNQIWQLCHDRESRFKGMAGKQVWWVSCMIHAWNGASEATFQVTTACYFRRPDAKRHFLLQMAAWQSQQVPVATTAYHQPQTMCISAMQCNLLTEIKDTCRHLVSRCARHTPACCRNTTYTYRTPNLVIIHNLSHKLKCSHCLLNEKALGETQTLRAGCSKVEPKICAPPWHSTGDVRRILQIACGRHQSLSPVVIFALPTRLRCWCRQLVG